MRAGGSRKRTLGEGRWFGVPLVDQPVYNIFCFSDVGWGRHTRFDGFYKVTKSVDVLFQHDANVRDKLPRIEAVIAVIPVLDLWQSGDPPLTNLT